MTWVYADEAAAMLAVHIPTVHVIAHRDHWRRIKVGHRVAYALDDVTDTLDARVDKITRDGCKVRP